MTEDGGVVGEISIKITDEEIQYDSELTLTEIVFFLETVKQLIVRQALENNK